MDRRDALRGLALRIIPGRLIILEGQGARKEQALNNKLEDSFNTRPEIITVENIVDLAVSKVKKLTEDPELSRVKTYKPSESKINNIDLARRRLRVRRARCSCASDAEKSCGRRSCAARYNQASKLLKAA